MITLNDPHAYGIASCVKLAMTKAREKLINQLAMMILKYTQFVIRQCLKGKVLHVASLGISKKD